MIIGWNLKRSGCLLKTRQHSSQHWRPTWTSQFRRQSWQKLTSSGTFSSSHHSKICIHPILSLKYKSRNDVIGLLREIDDWTKDTWVLFNCQPSPILDFPQICSQVAFDSPGHRSHPPWTVWDSSCHRCLFLEKFSSGFVDTKVPGTTRFSCHLPRCYQPLPPATVPS